MTVRHRELAAGRWFGLPLVEQMANIGSEIERTIPGAAATQKTVRRPSSADWNCST